MENNTNDHFFMLEKDISLAKGNYICIYLNQFNTFTTFLQLAFIPHQNIILTII